MLFVSRERNYFCFRRLGKGSGRMMIILLYIQQQVPICKELSNSSSGRQLSYSRYWVREVGWHTQGHTASDYATMCLSSTFWPFIPQRSRVITSYHFPSFLFPSLPSEFPAQIREKLCLWTIAWKVPYELSPVFPHREWAWTGALACPAHGLVQELTKLVFIPEFLHMPLQLCGIHTETGALGWLSQ